MQIVVCKPLNTIKGYRPLSGIIDTKSTQKSNESPDCSGMLMRHFADSTAGHTPSVITSQWKNADALDCKILQCTEKLNFAPADGLHNWSDMPIRTEGS